MQERLHIITDLLTRHNKESQCMNFERFRAKNINPEQSEDMLNMWLITAYPHIAMYQSKSKANNESSSKTGTSRRASRVECSLYLVRACCINLFGLRYKHHHRVNDYNIGTSGFQLNVESNEAITLVLVLWHSTKNHSIFNYSTLNRYKLFSFPFVVSGVTALHAWQGKLSHLI